MNDKPTVDLHKLKPITKFIYTLGVLPTSYLMSMTYQEQLTWICNFFSQTVIPAINDNVEATTELQTLYVELQDFVNNYFDNLDVTEEIENKLDKMAQDGSLTNIIASYVDPIYQNYQNQINQEITTFKNTVNGELDSQDQEIETVRSLAESVASGSPKGVYATVSDLTTADPDHDSIYVVSADGHWYYYNGSNWTDGGVYQSTSLDSGAVSIGNLNSNLQEYIKQYELETAEITNTGTVLSGTVGQTISTSVNQYYSYGVLSVVEGDTISVPFIDRSEGYGTGGVIFLTDSDDKILYTFPLSDLKDASNEPKLFTYDIPAGVTKAYWNTKHQNGSTMKWYLYKVKKFDYVDQRLTSQLTNKESINATSTISGIYSNNDLGLVIASYETRIYPVNPLDKINLITTVASSNTLCAGVFMDSDGKPVGYVGPMGNSGGNTNVNKDVIVPASASYLYVSVQNSGVTSSVSKYVFSDTPTKKLSVAYESGVLTITNNDNSNYIIMKNFGINNLFGFQTYSVGSTTVSSSTDMTPAPYWVEAVNDGDGDRTTLGFTGGCHGYDNTNNPGTTPTASEVSKYVYCDGTLLSNNNSTTCDTVKIIVTNNVQGSNTCLEVGGGRSVLQEKFVYEFDGTTLKVFNTITPLEDIVISRYYGIQLTGVNNSLYKVYGDKIYGYSTQSSLTNKPYEIIGGVLGAKMFDDGIGSYQYNSDSKVIISDNKAYFVPIRGQNVTLTENDVIYFKGEYIIDSNQN